MSADQYLQSILVREQVDTTLTSPVRRVHAVIAPAIQHWAGVHLVALTPSGSFAKGTANRSGTDIDLFISLSHDITETLQQVYDKLHDRLKSLGYAPRRQNVSIGITVAGHSVDLVPAKRQSVFSSDHSLYRRKAGTWTKTNIDTHVRTVATSGRQAEIRILKLWRNQKGLDFPSFYLELTVINALYGKSGTLSQNVWTVFEYLRDKFANVRVVDPANTNNIISDDLTVAEKDAIVMAARTALSQKTWGQIVV